ncbi:MAG: hypothetical protein RJB61_2497, partial [Actinomycetota bacterium]
VRNLNRCHECRPTPMDERSDTTRSAI